jgi:hypothetical protein
MLKIIDNIVDKDTQDLIEKIVFSIDRSWTYHGAYNTPARWPKIPQSQQSPTFFFDIVKPDRRVLTNPIFEPLIRPILKFNPTQLLKIRCVMNCQPAPGSSIKINQPHIDSRPENYQSDSYKTAVYYVNDSTGPTILYKNRYNPTVVEDISLDTVEIDQKVDPKKGRLIEFDYDIYHSSAFPEFGSRAIINYNFL